MKVAVRVMVQDPDLVGSPRVETIELDAESEACFLDGPISDRVAILDFEPDSGELLPGARFVRGADGAASYDQPPESEYHDPAFYQPSVFGTVLQTLQMFEEQGALGRRVSWAFGAPQLLVVPRAGQWKNAFYERESNSLQFFFFPSAGGEGATIHTCLSHDIVAHETAHAVLDGICPFLYDALTPQALALHEAIADLTALIVSFRSPTLRRAVLEQNGGSIENSNEFSAIASQFGADRGGAGYLRNLRNDRTLRLDDTSVDEHGERNFVAPYDPHRLSTVLTGALYSLTMDIHEQWKSKVPDLDDGLPTPRSKVDIAERALGITAEQLKRMLFRALDYLPPGEVTFADYGRALVAADRIAFPDREHERDLVKREMVRRGIVDAPDELEAPLPTETEALEGVSIAELLRSDYAAYRFVEGNRELLGIPANTSFEVLPRLDVERRYHPDEPPEKELVLKVSWSAFEANPDHPDLPRQRRVRFGTTLVIGSDPPRPKARLVGGGRSADAAARDGMLEHLLDTGTLVPLERARGPHGRLLRSVIPMRTVGGRLDVSGSARLLHVAGG